jgi:hypothetical protein
MSAKLDAKKEDLPRHVPRCWPHGVRGLPLRKCLAPKSVNDQVTYASEAFLLKLYNNSRPDMTHPMDAQPSWRLAKLLDKRLPGWELIFKRRWSATDLLSVSDSIADAAFLNVVHMYKHVIGKHFPDGVFDWPPTSWLKSYHERKERVRDSKRECEEPESKRRRLVGKTGIQMETLAVPARHQLQADDDTRAVAGGCQPRRGVESLAEALHRGRKDDHKTEAKAAGNAAKPSKEPLPGTLPRQPKSTKEAQAKGTGGRPRTTDGDRRSSDASSSSSSSVLSRGAAASHGLLNLAAKWEVDASGKL